MTFTVFILAVTAVLCAAVITGLAVIVSGIRKGDRATHLAGKPSTQLEAITRRVLGLGVRDAGACRGDGEEL